MNEKTACNNTLIIIENSGTAEICNPYDASGARDEV